MGKCLNLLGDVQQEEQQMEGRPKRRLGNPRRLGVSLSHSIRRCMDGIRRKRVLEWMLSAAGQSQPKNQAVETREHDIIRDD